jgi:hypothetical protein
MHIVIHPADSSCTVWEGSLPIPFLPSCELPRAALQAAIEKP